MSTFVTVMPQIIQSMNAAVNELVLDSAKAVHGGVVTAMDDGKSGVHYRNLPNVSSAPGEAPATQSGDYVAATKAEPDGDKKAVAYTGAIQAPRLEYGDAKVAMRPNWAVQAAKEASIAEQRGADKLREAAERISL